MFHHLSMRFLLVLAALLAWTCVMLQPATAAEEEKATRGGELVPDRLRPKPPHVGDTSSMVSADGPCARSIFETRVPYRQVLPDEREQMLSSPARHPDKAICGSYANKDSCCSAKTLDDLVAWSDALDASMTVTRYTKRMIERDPQLLVDEIIIYLRAMLKTAPVDWKAVRIQFREPVGKLIADAWKAIFPPFAEFWSAIVTYQEGLLCSSCEPGFNKYFNGTSVTLRVEAAGEVADGFLKVLAALDAFLQSHNEDIIRIVKPICEMAVDIPAKCTVVPTVVNMALNYITKSPLREIFCGPTKGNIDIHNQKCRDVIVFEVLRGLYIDVKPFLWNALEYYERSCPKDLGVPCPDTNEAKAALNDYFFFSFDERPIVSNVYSVDGYDVKNAACSSNLSGYACGGPGPKPESHKSPDSSGSVAAIIIIILVVLAIAALGVVLYISRDRIKRVTQTFYTRMRDGDDGNGPTVGLV